MRTVGNAEVLASLTARVEGLTPRSPRQWGKMNVQQMLRHLATSMEWVLEGGEARPWPRKPSRLMKHLALRLPMGWPRGLPNPMDPASVDVPVSELEALRERVALGLETMSRWTVSETTPPHPAFGRMTTWEWRRWAYKHADHHLKQFGR
ncbi:MAG: DUF1569 domain-containing protein [Longimicrobiales bacterium]|nr:DUF1569 domain-containing protein [Longimicrobiales bacterium]